MTPNTNPMADLTRRAAHVTMQGLRVGLSPEERDALREELREMSRQMRIPIWSGPSQHLNAGAARRADAIDWLLDDHARLTVALQAATEDGALLNRLEAWLIERPGERSLTVPREDAKSFTLFQCDEDRPRLGMKRCLRNALRAALPTEDTKR